MPHSRVGARPTVDDPSFLVSEPWLIDNLRIGRRGGVAVVDAEGWAFPHPDLEPAAPRSFLLNGRPFPHVRYPIERGDVGAAFWQRRNARHSGFRCVASGAHDDIFPDGVLELAY